MDHRLVVAWHLLDQIMRVCWVQRASGHIPGVGGMGLVEGLDDEEAVLQVQHNSRDCECDANMLLNRLFSPVGSSFAPAIHLLRLQVAPVLQ